MYKKNIYIVVIVISLFLESCGVLIFNEEKMAMKKLKIHEEQYQPYKLQKTLEGYREFIAKYPKNLFVKEAQLQIENLEFAPYEEEDSVEGYMEFKMRYPTNRHTYKASVKIEQVCQALSGLAGRHEKHKITIGGLGTFPNIRRPRVIWIGIQVPETLKALHQELETATAKLGFPPEKRSFKPHLTIGRVKKHISSDKIDALQIALSGTNIGFIDTVEVEALHLFKSDLKPSGAVYTKLYSAELNNPSTR